MKVYLSGTIAGLNYEQANAWRVDATEKLRDFGIQTINPLRGRMFGESSEEIFDPNELVHRDLRDLRVCDIVLAYMDTLSLGTAMEIWHTYYTEKKPVIFVTTNDQIRNHPWIHVTSTKIFCTLDEAITYIVTRWADEEEI